MEGGFLNWNTPDTIKVQSAHALVTDVIGDEKKDNKFRDAKLRLTCVKQRIFGMIAPKVPSLHSKHTHFMVIR